MDNIIKESRYKINQVMKDTILNCKLCYIPFSVQFRLNFSEEGFCSRLCCKESKKNFIFQQEQDERDKKEFDKLKRKATRSEMLKQRAIRALLREHRKKEKEKMKAKKLAEKQHNFWESKLKLLECKVCGEPLSESNSAMMKDKCCTISCLEKLRGKKIERKLDRLEEEGEPVTIEDTGSLMDCSDWIRHGHLNFGMSSKSIVDITRIQYNGGYEE